MPRLKLNDGSPSMHALHIGLRDTTTLDLRSGERVQVTLSHNGTTYDVDAATVGEPRQHVDLPDGSRIVAGWAQFDSLNDARLFKRSLTAKPSMKAIAVACLNHVQAH